jgi:lipid-A-disaccharide synthase
VLFPEYVTCGDKSPQIAAHVVEWLTDRRKRDARVAALADLKARVAHGGASENAARYILRVLTPPARVPRPHFMPAHGAEAQGAMTAPAFDAATER